MNHEKTIIDENELISQRKMKLKELRKQGVAYPNKFRKAHFADELHAQYGAMDNETLQNKKNQVKIAGRIMLCRIMGKASFIQLQDMTGRIQCYLRKNDLPEGIYDEFKKWDLGDIIGVEGFVFKTKTGELSIHAEKIQLLSKCLLPLPDKFHGLVDKEQQYRQRYVDLIVNEKSRRTFLIRTKIVSGIREFFDKRRYIEVETPIMQVIPGGAAAKPFVTYHNTLDMELYLRIAPELYLKKLVVGGFERVYEIGRNFRNEGLSTKHNPEFTTVEFYQAYATYHDLIALTEALMKKLAKDILGTTSVEYEDQVFDFGKSFEKMTLKESILKFNPKLKSSDLDDFDKTKEIAEKLGVLIKPTYGLGKLQFEIFEKTVEDNLIQPTFIMEYPAEVSPLARRNDDNPFITDRFEFFVGGREIANGFSELNDPEDQVERFLQQMKEKEAGDEEAMHYDANYIKALEYGLPPTAGEGIGIDRLTMLFANTTTIRDVILFPHMRAEKQALRKP